MRTKISTSGVFVDFVKVSCQIGFHQVLLLKAIIASVLCMAMKLASGECPVWFVVLSIVAIYIRDAHMIYYAWTNFLPAALMIRMLNSIWVDISSTKKINTNAFLILMPNVFKLELLDVNDITHIQCNWPIENDEEFKRLVKVGSDTWRINLSETDIVQLAKNSSRPERVLISVVIATSLATKSKYAEGEEMTKAKSHLKSMCGWRS